MDSWVVKLTSNGREQEQALLELGDLLKTRVARSFRNQPKVDASFVDDVVQDSLMTILNSLDQFQGASQFLTWATTLAVRTALRQMRRLRWKDTSLDQMLSDRPDAVETQSGREQDPSAGASSAQLIQTMYRIIKEHLTDKQRDVLMAHLSGMPQAEIGARMGTNRNAIYKLGFDARKRLKAGLVKAGYSAEDLATLEATQ